MSAAPSFADPPFACPPDQIEIVLDLPIPPSVNRIWRHSRGHVYSTKEYIQWQRDAYYAVRERQEIPRGKITGPFEICIYLSRSACSGDGDNRIKATLDWLQLHKIIANDRDCQGGSWRWVDTAQAPSGCRLTLRVA